MSNSTPPIQAPRAMPMMVIEMAMPMRAPASRGGKYSRTITP